MFNVLFFAILFGVFGPPVYAVLGLMALWEKLTRRGEKG